MADDPVEAARRREARMLGRSSYFPAANLRQFEGTELSPPGAGTYYNPERYRGFQGNIGRIQRELAKAYQSDLTFNVMANPKVAQSLEAERIGAQHGGGGSFSGKPGYQTVQLPGGGTTVVTDAVAKRLLQQPGYSIAGGAAGGERFSGVSAPTSELQPISGGVEMATRSQPTFSGLGPSAPTQPSFFSAVQRFFTPSFVDPGAIKSSLGFLGRTIGGAAGYFNSNTQPTPTQNYSFPHPRFGSNDTGDLLRDIDGSFYGGGHAPPTPTPTPVQPRRYFDTGFV